MLHLHHHHHRWHWQSLNTAAFERNGLTPNRNRRKMYVIYAKNKVRPPCQ
jgi:hypothetical protein